MRAGAPCFRQKATLRCFVALWVSPRACVTRKGWCLPAAKHQHLAPASPGAPLLLCSHNSTCRQRCRGLKRQFKGCSDCMRNEKHAH